MRVPKTIYVSYHAVGVLIALMGISAQYAHVPIVPFVALAFLLKHARVNIRPE